MCFGGGEKDDERITVPSAGGVGVFAFLCYRNTHGHLSAAAALHK